MSRSYRLWEQAQIVNLLEPATDSAGRTSPYVTLAQGHKAYIVCHIAQGSSSTILLSVLQATSSAAAGSKAVTNNLPIAVNQDTATSDVFTNPTDAKVFTTDANTLLKVVIFEVDPSKALDIANGFKYIAVSTGASSASNITSALLVVTPLRNGANPVPTTTGA